MNLAFTEVQQMLKSSARELLAQECPPSIVREAERDDAGCPPRLWRTMVEAGWTGLVIPSEFGGAGGDLMDLAVLIEEMGRAIAPGPFFASTVLGCLTVMDAADAEAQQSVLPAIANGETIMTLAMLEEGGRYAPESIAMPARRDGDGYLLNGVKLFVDEAQAANLLIVAARTSDSGAPSDGVTLFLLPTDAAGVRIEPHLAMSPQRQCAVAFDDVRVTADMALGPVDGGWAILDRTLQRAAALKCAEMVGGADAALEMTLAYLKQRVQFGRPIATFQALQHHCANMAMDVEGSRYAAYQAIWRLSEGIEARREVAIAKAWASEACNRVCTLAHQCHGAIGFTEEYNLQLYSRTARQQEQEFGDARYHRRALADALRAQSS